MSFICGRTVLPVCVWFSLHVNRIPAGNRREEMWRSVIKWCVLPYAICATDGACYDTVIGRDFLGEHFLIGLNRVFAGMDFFGEHFLIGLNRVFAGTGCIGLLHLTSV